MTKSLDYDFVGLFKSILMDVSGYHPDDHDMWDKDLESLAHLSRTRGMPIFTMDLPALGKLLDSSLDRGSLSLSGNLTATIQGTKIPRLFQGLWSRLFEDDGVLKCDIDPNDVLFLRTLLYVGKNYRAECSPRYLFEATKEFYYVEAHLPCSDPFWDDHGSHIDDNFGRLADLRIQRYVDALRNEESGVLIGPGSIDRRADALCDSIQREADKIAGTLGWFDPDEWNFKHGPGAVSDLKRGEFKYDFPNWNPRLESVFPYDRFGTSQYGLLDRLQPDGIDLPFVEGHSKLIAVPKTQKGPRLIAAEPTCNQWAQQCVRDYLYSRVAATYLSEVIRFNDQTANQEYARLGSLNGKYATIDLKSASDRLSTQLVQRVFRRNLPLMEALRACRTRYIRNDLDKKLPSLHKLRKFSTQGSALTFPVQSLVFTAIALGVGKYLEPHRTTQDLCKDVRVFGDDIIVPVGWVDDTVEALEGFYLKVNASKSFWKGSFRESCGADMWKGYDVTPPHVSLMGDKSNPVAVASNVAVSNNFHRKGFWNAASWIKTSGMPGLIPVVDHASGMFGFISFSGAQVPQRTRWNKKLQRYEVYVTTVHVATDHVKQDTSGAMLQYFTEDPAAYIDYRSGVAVGGVPVIRHAWVDVSEFD
ncbi:RNA-directed RNA polymerase [ssRNA phage SRR6960507_12]|uniref:RNA-directed RNA polymerase n=1 Tax=ssRNA phage SRR6960507_12 TaxID=2786510 RepID=A0A8S5L3A0_9VIRU|nr:RNA-directed RNA polymerase [ssRNA phage SRR6960507_12]DAD52254.1 TPA_asm: RNA-directed RNA polymerase [ssRNA phage SRR6960507_12]